MNYGYTLQGAHPFPPFLLPPVWNMDVMTAAPAALLDHKFESCLVRTEGSLGGGGGFVELFHKSWAAHSGLFYFLKKKKKIKICVFQPRLIGILCNLQLHPTPGDMGRGAWG